MIMLTTLPNLCHAHKLQVQCQKVSIQAKTSLARQFPVATLEAVPTHYRLMRLPRLLHSRFKRKPRRIDTILRRVVIKSLVLNHRSNLEIPHQLCKILRRVCLMQVTSLDIEQASLLLKSHRRRTLSRTIKAPRMNSPRSRPSCRAKQRS